MAKRSRRVKDTVTEPKMAKRSRRVKDTVTELMNDDDRISRLPDGVIHHIYSFRDARSSVQSSVLSRRWRNTWKSHPRLNFENNLFSSQTSGFKYPNFAQKFLSARVHVAELSAIDFRSNSISLLLLKKILDYAMSHHTRKVNIEFLGSKQTRRGGFDLSLFRSHFLEHLCLSIDFEIIISPPVTWDLPALVHLNLDRVKIRMEPSNDSASKSIDLFSGFPNLKTLVLTRCLLSNFSTFIIASSKLEYLSLKGLYCGCKFVISAPKLASFTYYGMPQFSLISNDLLSLKTVEFGTLYHKSFDNKAQLGDLMIKTFVQLSKAETLTVNLDVLWFLLENPDLLEKRCCPFMRLQSLTLVVCKLPPSLAVFVAIVKFFRRGSPSIKFHLKIDSTPPIVRYRIW
ncbi:F-box domain, Leucine-rich repeat domain, L domain-like protein [Artemisia annua]|uniref:F-box domain, Leucine-rich repeat domain, L domain-like protein n=1 Tax=Artemisia annua TaxID=35608 RepID=A0A2U1NZK9_ARTAN|nr:F-box domain, Leucine-rich repeat domain, L domain-like protein [Artemisia annua]